MEALRLFIMQSQLLNSFDLIEIDFDVLLLALIAPHPVTTR